MKSKKQTMESENQTKLSLITKALLKKSFQRFTEEAISDPPTIKQINTMQEIIHRHSISQSVFYSFIHAFFTKVPSDPGFPKSLGIKASDIIAALKTKEIEDIVTVNISNAQDNGDLDFEPNIPPIADLSLLDPTQANYSVGLLYGLATFHPGSTFLFCKAKKYDYVTGVMKNTVVFAIESGVYNVYFGDLTEMHP